MGVYVDFTTNRYSDWKKKIAEDDVIKFAKEDTLRTAIELHYKPEVLTQIINAKTETELYRIMINARKSA